MTEDLPFSGIKVLDVSQGVAGPHCGLLMAQHGADVIKLEPLAGDWGRALGTTYGDHCAYALQVNRGKRSIAVDLKNEEGRRVAAELAAQADVVLESFRPGVMKRFGLDYESVRKTNENVVYLSVTGFGQEGPYIKQPVTDAVMQAFSGFMSINRDQEGNPQRISVIAIDVMTGLYAFQALAPALFKRFMKGTGAYLDISLMQSALAFQAAKVIEFMLEDGKPVPPGVPVATFKTRSGYININARRDPHFRALCEVLRRPELAEDPRFSTVTARNANEQELLGILRPLVETWTRAAIGQALRQRDVLCADVADYNDVVADPQVQAVEGFSWLEPAGMGRVPMANIPGTRPLSGDPRMQTAPDIGQHTEEVLRQLGYRDSDISRLAEAGAVARRKVQKAA